MFTKNVMRLDSASLCVCMRLCVYVCM
jgi:hypothetical protein